MCIIDGDSGLLLVRLYVRTSTGLKSAPVTSIDEALTAANAGAVRGRHGDKSVIMGTCQYRYEALRVEE